MLRLPILHRSTNMLCSERDSSRVLQLNPLSGTGRSLDTKQSIPLPGYMTSVWREALAVLLSVVIISFSLTYVR